MDVYYDVYCRNKLIQTDLDKSETQDLFEIDEKEVNRICNLGLVFLEQYSVVQSEQDEPIPKALMEEWNRVVCKFRRRSGK